MGLPKKTFEFPPKQILFADEKMKLKFQHIIPIILGFALFSPIPVLAIQKGEIITPEEYGIGESPVENVPGAVGVLRGVVQTTYIVFFIIATLFILFAAYNYLTAQGAPEKINTAHKQLLYAGIAIVVALLAVGTSAIIRNFLENPSAGGGGGGGVSTPEDRRFEYDSEAFPAPSQL